MKMKRAILFTLCFGIIISLFSVTVFADSSMAEFTELPTGFELTVAEPMSGDSYQIWVGKKGVTEDELANIDDEEDFMSQVGYVDFALVKGNNPLTFSFNVSDSSEFGVYAVRLIRSSIDGMEEAYYIFRLADPTLSLRAIDAFMTVDTNEDFVASLAAFSTEPDDYLDYNSFGILQDASVAATIGENFALIRDYKYAEGGQFETPTDIMKCAEAAYALSALMGEDVDEASDRIEKYVSFIPEIFPAKKDAEKAMKLLSGAKEYIVDSESLGMILSVAKQYAESSEDEDLILFDEFKTKISSKDDFETVVKWSVLLSKIKNATRADLEKIITDNSVFLGVDVSAGAHYGVNLANVAHRFDVDKAGSLYGTAAFSKYYDDIAKAIYDENNKQSQQQASRPSSSGGGGGFGNKTVYTKQEETVSTEKTEEVSAQDTVKLPFNDIADCAWAHEDIKSLYDKGIVSGVAADSFEPNRPVTRAEFVKMMVVAFNISANNEAIFAFDDISRDMWCYPYVEVAYRSGIVSGKDKNHFGAAETITRQDAAVMIARVLGITSTSKGSFSDVNAVSDYATSSVAAVAEAGIMNGMENGNFEPMGTTTRAQAATIISRAMQGGASK